MSDTPSILVLEDDAATLKIVSQALEASGFRTRQARTAMEAVAAARKERPDLILADIGLPDMDGATATSLLHDEPDFASIPIVLVSAMEESELKGRMEESGAVDILPKPFSPDELIRTVRRWAAVRDSESTPT